MWISILSTNILLFFLTAVGLVVLLLYGSDVGAFNKKIHLAPQFLRQVMAKIALPGPVTIHTINDDWTLKFTKPFLKIRLLAMIQRQIQRSTINQVVVSGRARNSEILAQRCLSYMILSAFAIVPLSIFAGVAVSYPLLLLSSIPLSCLIYPRVRIFLDVSERKASIDDELAFVALYGSVMQHAGVSLYQSITDIIGKEIFPRLEHEAKMLFRDVRLFGFDQFSALNNHALSHPNTSYRNLLLGYVSVGTSGGDLARYMETKSQELLHKIQFRHVHYRTQAQLIGEIMLILLTVLPIVILTSSFLLAENSVRTLVIFSLFVIPIITTMIIAVTNLSQPKIHNLVDFDPKSIFLAVTVSAFLFIMGQPLWLVAGVGTAVAALLCYIWIFRQFREIAFAESAISDFLRDVTEYHKIGIIVPNSIMRISETVVITSNSIVSWVGSRPVSDTETIYLIL